MSTLTAYQVIQYWPYAHPPGQCRHCGHTQAEHEPTRSCRVPVLPQLQNPFKRQRQCCPCAYYR